MWDLWVFRDLCCDETRRLHWLVKLEMLNIGVNWIISQYPIAINEKDKYYRAYPECRRMAEV